MSIPNRNNRLYSQFNTNLSNKGREFNVTNSAHLSTTVNNYTRQHSQPIILADEFNKELLKHDINVEKWYHLLLIGNYYKQNGSLYYEDGILKRLAIEYQKALKSKQIDTLVLIKNELMNHIPEHLWIHKFFMGEVYDKNGKPLYSTNADLEMVAKEYQNVYSKAHKEVV